MSKVADLVSERPHGWLQSCLRFLPPAFIRSLIVADLTLATCNPLWGWWLYRRWTDRSITWRGYWPIYKRWLVFTWQHYRYGKSHAGLWAIAWRSPPMRHARHSERDDYQPKGSCGTCSNCCKTSWRPPAEQVACPFLGENHCMIYGGLFWDYFNCGRYPTGQPELRVYACPRFTIAQTDLRGGDGAHGARHVRLVLRDLNE
ncbi:MAG: hypothetical protein GWN21_05290 [Gammaproteobacteria bacterium]|nr:hypothetical protein [Gammaproteobacteria bacterium]NIR20046.1 hypothetical protein [Gammaproteobacteria bacterium]NIR23135.1 hypothetical protein [Gammaproteobacteria bacterium]NIS04408.1 hypothetical protein [Gammaproteobacteria bacterium]NIW54698.1 hypothetical protein [Gammaproteobacteria bacterium]